MPEAAPQNYIMCFLIKSSILLRIRLSFEYKQVIRKRWGWDKFMIAATSITKLVIAEKKAQSKVLRMKG